MNLIAGQNGYLSAILLAGGILALERRRLLAGILFGMLCYKPQLGVLLPFALAAGGYWRTFVSAALTVAAMVGLSVLLLGAGTWTAFAHTAPYNHLLMEQGYGFWRRMPTPFAFVRLAGGTVDLAYAVQILSAVLAIVATVLIWRSGAAFAVKSGALLLGTFLVTPYAWDYDLVVLTFAVALLAMEAAKTGFLPWEKITLAAVVAAPALLTGIATASHIQIGPFVLWAAFLFAMRRALVPLAADVASHPGLKRVSLGSGNV
jgi:hypothetical protein